VVPTGVSAIVKIVKTRRKFYTNRQKVNKMTIDKNGRKKRIKAHDPGGSGWEIAKEIKICPNCDHYSED
jgi:hypothetical protein